MYYFLENKEGGFTLIELLIAMAIAGIVLGTVTSTFIVQRKSYNVEEQITEMVQTARAAMDMMSREIRMAGYDPTGAGFDGIPYNVNQLQIVADLDGDGDTDDANEDIIYTYDAPNLQIDRDTGSGGQPFAENIQALTFTYLDSTGSATTTTANIRQIQITITARTSKADPDYSANGGYRSYMLTSLITPINLAL